MCISLSRCLLKTTHILFLHSMHTAFCFSHFFTMVLFLYLYLWRATHCFGGWDTIILSFCISLPLVVVDQSGGYDIMYSSSSSVHTTRAVLWRSSSSSLMWMMFCWFAVVPVGAAAVGGATTTLLPITT